MCNRKTKQWHIKPKLAEYKTMNVYCIVNKLKKVSKRDTMMERSPWRCWLSVLLTLPVKDGRGRRVDELEVHCHLRFAMSGTEQLTTIHSVFRCSFAYKMLQLQNWIHEQLKCTWVFTPTMMVFPILLKFKKKKGVKNTCGNRRGGY